MKNTWKNTVSLTLVTAMILALGSCGKKGDYVHGKKGYYSQVDNGISSEVTKQGSGGCWGHAATSSILISSLVRDGKKLDFTPVDILKSVLTGHEEGWHYDLDVNVTPGKGSIVINSLSNGIGDSGYALVEAPIYSGSDENNEPYSFATREQIQEIIKTRGSVMAGISFGGANFYGSDHGYYTLYDDPAKKGDLHHEICLVGWDDYFPKEYFGAFLGKDLPKNDGAWLAKDSMGPDYANDGYFWISYDSNLVYDSLLYVSDKYSKILSYEGGCLDSIDTGDQNMAANVFHEKGKLAAVGTYVGIRNVLGNDYVLDPSATRIKIEVRDASMTEVLATKEAEFTYGGYYVIDLDSPLDVEDYSIVITYSSAIPVESEVPESHHGVYYVSGSEAGQSFILKDGKWIDMSDPSAKEIFGMEYTPNNVCIKALYLES
ncbi:MAG: hypothetical protein IKD90_09480 [Clostridiales bacterium]|nr:hypothetical protein [Clostridiales bacterium]